MNDTIKHIPIKVIVTVDGERFGKHVGVDGCFGHQQIDDFVTDWVADEWADYAAARITKVEWIYISKSFTHKGLRLGRRPAAT